MPGDTDRRRWGVTIDHDRIVDWADQHDAVPVRVDRPDGRSDLDVVTDPEDVSGRQISWEQFFERFEADEQAFRYVHADAVEGDPDECEVVDYEEVIGGDVVERRDLADERPGRTESRADSEEEVAEQIGTSDTGEDEPVVVDRVESDEEDAETETAMSESARGAESPALVLDEIYGDPGPESDPDNEYLVFENTGEGALDLSGWTVENSVGRSYVFPEGFALGPGNRVTLHSGDGEDTETDLYWNARGPIWDDKGDTVTVTTDDGTRILSEPYRS